MYKNDIKGIRFFKAIKSRFKSREREVVVYSEKLKISNSLLLFSSLIILIIVLISYTLIQTSTGNYLGWWFFWCSTAIVTLIASSSPYKLTISETNLTIHGYMDIEQIPIDSIESIEIVDEKEYNKFAPIFCSYGFLGIYGYFFYFTEKCIVKLHTTKHSEWLIIKTNNDLMYVISVASTLYFLEKYNRLIKK